MGLTVAHSIAIKDPLLRPWFRQFLPKRALPIDVLIAPNIPALWKVIFQFLFPLNVTNPYINGSQLISLLHRAEQKRAGAPMDADKLPGSSEGDDKPAPMQGPRCRRVDNL